MGDFPSSYTNKQFLLSWATLRISLLNIADDIIWERFSIFNFSRFQKAFYTNLELSFMLLRIVWGFFLYIQLHLLHLCLEYWEHRCSWFRDISSFKSSASKFLVTYLSKYVASSWSSSLALDQPYCSNWPFSSGFPLLSSRPSGVTKDVLNSPQRSP